jgi:hypothetical protein
LGQSGAGRSAGSAERETGVHVEISAGRRAGVRIV